MTRAIIKKCIYCKKRLKDTSDVFCSDECAEYHFDETEGNIEESLGWVEHG